MTPEKREERKTKLAPRLVVGRRKLALMEIRRRRGWVKVVSWYVVEEVRKMETKGTYKVYVCCMREDENGVAEWFHK